MSEYIEYKGNKYPISVSYYALKMTRKETGLSQEELKKQTQEETASQFSLETYEIMLWYALKAGAELDDTEVTLPREKMEFVLDANFKLFLKLVENAMPEEMKEKAIAQVDEGQIEVVKKPQGNRAQRRKREKA